MLDKAIAISIMLFILSMISERIVTWIKLEWGREGKKLPGFSHVGEDLTIHQDDPAVEKIREKKIAGLTIFISMVVAFSSNANLLEIFNATDPYQAIGYPDKWSFKATWFIGCPLSGLFISLGSKFWHDLLDMLLEVKNYRRLLADPNTYKVDKTETLDKMLTMYESDFIKAAFLEAKSHFMVMQNVKAFSVKRDSDGDYFDLTLQDEDPQIGDRYNYTMNDETPVSVRIKKYVMGDSDKIVAHSPNLSSKIYNSAAPSDWGTLGCLVKPLDPNSTDLYILTCCHNVVHPVTKLPNLVPDKVGIIDDPKNGIDIGNIVDAVRDSTMDAAVIKINTDQKTLIKQAIPTLGRPLKTKTLKASDKTPAVSLFGSESRGVNQSGVVTSIVASVTITYSFKDDHLLNNLLVVSNKGKAVSKAGDSGACVIDDNYNLIGLLVAGNSRESYVMPIEPLLTKFKMQLA